MKKSIVMVVSALLLLLAVIFLALPYYFGVKAEASLQAQSRMLARTSFLEVVSYRYERHWFSATETTVIRFKPALARRFASQLPDNVNTLLHEPITLVNHVQHGPFADGLKPARAVVSTQLQYSPEVAKILARFFGTQIPVTIHNRLDLLGGGTLDVAIPSFDYEELSGIKMHWQGLNGQVRYAENFVRYDTQVASPGLKITLADKGEVSYQGLQFTAHTEDGQSQLSLGNSQFKLGEINLVWRDGIDYDIKLNELLNLVTDLQIGAFINPTGTVAPSQVNLKDFSFDTKMAETGEFIEADGRMRFAKLMYGTEAYGPMDVDVRAEHLHAGGLLALKTKMAELADRGLPEDSLRTEIIAAARQEGLPLFTHDPVFKLNRFELNTPQGQLKVAGQMGFKGVQAADLSQFNALVNKTEADFQISVPQKLLENMAENQASRIFSVDKTAENPPDMADVKETARLMVSSTLQSMQRDGYLQLSNGIVQSQIKLVQNKLHLNGKPFETTPEPDYDEITAEEPVAASAPAVPAKKAASAP